MLSRLPPVPVSAARVPFIGGLVSFAGFDLFLGLFDHLLDHLDRVGVVHNSERPPVTCDLLPKIWSFLFQLFLATKCSGESVESYLSPILSNLSSMVSTIAPQ
jgi:hypothetical protein